MAYLFLSDGGPDAEEFESNYLYFDESDPNVVAEIERILSKKRSGDPSAFTKLEELCNSSLKPKKKDQSNFMSKIKKYIEIRYRKIVAKRKFGIMNFLRWAE